MFLKKGHLYVPRTDMWKCYGEVTQRPWRQPTTDRRVSPPWVLSHSSTSNMLSHMYNILYIYISRTQMTLVLLGKGLVLSGSSLSTYFCWWFKELICRGRKSDSYVTSCNADVCYKVGPLPVLTEVVTRISRVITQLPIYKAISWSYDSMYKKYGTTLHLISGFFWSFSGL